MKDASEKIQTQVAMRPFRPFSIETRAGTLISVTRPEWFHEWPEGDGEFVVFLHGGYSLLNYRDITGTILVEGPAE
jgi:hypothetical protein